MFIPKLIVALLVVPSALAENLQFECTEFDVAGVCVSISPDVVDEGHDLKVVSTVAGLGNAFNSGGRIDFEIAAEGELDSVCENKGKTAAPGQNPVVGGVGELLGVDEQSQNGSVEFDITANSGCTCGFTCNEADGNGCADPKTKKIRGELVTEPADCIDGEECCQADFERCPSGCDCKVFEGYESCPNGNWDQFADGVKYTGFVVQAVLWDGKDTLDTADDDVIQIQRLDCSIVPLTEDGPVPASNVICVQCTLCRKTGNTNPCLDYVPDGIANGCPVI